MHLLSCIEEGKERKKKKKDRVAHGIQLRHRIWNRVSARSLNALARFISDQKL